MNNETAPEMRVMVYPTDTNPGGDVFGGYMMAQVDVAGSILAIRIGEGKVLTRAVKYFDFIKPSFVGNILSFYTEIQKVGRTSITIGVKVYAEDLIAKTNELVVEASLVYVAVDNNGRPRPFPELYIKPAWT